MSISLHASRACPIAIALIAGALTLACDKVGTPVRDERAAALVLPEAPLRAELQRAPANFAAKGMALTAGRTRDDVSRAAVQPSGATMLIRTGQVTLRVDSLDAAIDAVKKLATSLGGHLANVSVNAGEHQVRSASLEMKVPAARFDDAVQGLAPIGKLEQNTSTVEDVGEEFVDITARIANARRLEERLVTLLATRTAKLGDVLTVERELARVREEIERYEGRVRYLSSRVAMSTVVAMVHEPAPILANQPGTNPMRVAFINMWRNFVRLVATGIELSGVVIPLALVVAVGLWGWRRVRRPRIAAAA